MLLLFNDDRRVVDANVETNEPRQFLHCTNQILGRHLRPHSI